MRRVVLLVAVAFLLVGMGQARAGPILLDFNMDAEHPAGALISYAGARIHSLATTFRWIRSAGYPRR